MIELESLLDRLINASDRSIFIVEHPVLLSAACHSFLSAAYARDPERLEALVWLQPYVEAVEREPETYPLGAGPIERLFDALQQGEVTFQVALATAVKPELFCELAIFYVQRLSLKAGSMVLGDEWRAAVQLQELVNAALDARRVHGLFDQAGMDFIATVHWLHIVIQAVSRVPDGRLFRDAISRAGSIGDSLFDPTGRYPPGEILHRLGVLHLDPYVTNRTSSGYQREFLVWQEQLVYERKVLFDERLDDEDYLPNVADALAAAADYLREAAGHRTGVSRGYTLKALVQALAWQKIVHVTPDLRELRSVAAEALTLLSGDLHLRQRAEIQNLLDWYADNSRDDDERTSASSEADALFEQPLEAWIDRLGSDRTVATFLQTMGSVLETDPRLALRLWLKVRELVEREFPSRGDYLRAGQTALLSAYSPGLPQRCSSLAERVDLVEHSSVGATPYDKAGMLVAAAIMSQQTNEEGAAVELLEAAAGISGGFFNDFGRLLIWIAGWLHADQAVNDYKAGRNPDAVSQYLRGAYHLIQSGVSEDAFEVVERAFSLASADKKSVRQFISGIGVVAPHLERTLGEIATVRLQEMYCELLPSLTGSGPFMPIEVLFLWDAAKGHAFGQAIAVGAPVEWLRGNEALDAEQRILNATRHLSAAELRTAMSTFDFETMLAAYVSPRERSGESAADRLRNLQVSFDAELNKALLGRHVPDETWFPTDSAVQDALGSKTVLLCLYTGMDRHGRIAYYTMCLTREKISFFCGILEESALSRIILKDGEQAVVSSVADSYAKAGRAWVQEDPGPRCASTEAIAHLEAHARLVLGGGLAETLADLHKAGKDHLCIWPHGAFQFYPYHLLGEEEQPLAGDWSITYLPNLRLLDPSRRSDEQHGPFVAIGIDFPADPQTGAPGLIGLENEAREVARLMGGCSITGPGVSKGAVLSALETSRRIHIAAHGELRVSAPSFQCLYLSPDLQTEVLYAYEVLNLCLRKVDLVTLSACETSLGRFDIADNLRGLSANLLIAGVSTIIGTLWSVETNTAAFFFSEFYRHLACGEAKGTAFRAAQTSTRARYPKYRDWGAFYLTGAVT